MDREEIIKIIDEKFDSLIKSDRYVFEKHLQYLDGRDVQLGRTTGTKFGTEGYVSGSDEGQKISFYNATPIIQPATVADASGCVGDADDKVNAVIDLLQSLGLMR